MPDKLVATNSRETLGDSRLTRLGMVFSAAWISALSIYAFNVWENFLAMTPDGFATFLAGAFSPLALGWVVLGFLQQGHELRQNAEALRLQSEELRNSVEQQRDLVEVTREQLHAELARSAHDRDELARVSNPQFRFTEGGHMTSDGMMQKDFTLVNVGVTCTDVLVLFEPLGLRRSFVTLPTGHPEQIRVTGRMGEFVPQTVMITYLNSRQLPGSAVFQIPVEDIAGYGLVLASPRATDISTA